MRFISYINGCCCSKKVGQLQELLELSLEHSINTNGHEYVDLGLPSGTLWATMNVGASSETDYGNYYKYGLGAEQYDNNQANYTGVENPLDSSVDTATQVWSGDWHIPTKTQLDELVANTTYQWVIDYQGSGVNGSTFTANGETLFIPAAGFYHNALLSYEDEYNYIWGSTSPDSSYAYALCIGDGLLGVDWGVGYYSRSFGYSVRPVLG